MNLDEVLHHRRSVRVYDKEKPIDTEKVKHCLELATLAPNSSDMQLWEFYHITEPELLAKISRDCLGQKAASTASQIVIFVVRRDWYKKHARFVLNFERENIRHYSPKELHSTFEPIGCNTNCPPRNVVSGCSSLFSQISPLTRKKTMFCMHLV